MKNLLSFFMMFLLAVCITSCASVEDPVVVLTPSSLEYDQENQTEETQAPAPEPEPAPVAEPAPAPAPEPEPEPEPVKEIKQAIQQAVKEEKKEFTIDFEKLSKQSLFEFNSDKIAADNYAGLDVVANFLKEAPNVSVKVEGHTDSVGAKEYNQKLSERRAKSVADYIISKGVDSSRVTTQGFGFSKPIASNKTKEGRAKNRRTELKFKIK
ncbi:MAG: OmpA family protein [Elusimicrobia bacterium]|nr:OmpA family protein [Elusimicrobiota bacterium]